MSARYKAKAAKLKSGDDEDDESCCSFSWSCKALVILVIALSLMIWSLPAPTLLGKLSLLRQSWQLNTVLDESMHLRSEIDTARRKKEDLLANLTKEMARAKDLQGRLDKSAGDTKNLQAQLEDEQAKKLGLTNSNSDLQATVEKSRERRRELLHKLQAVKRVEMAELATLDEEKVVLPHADKAAETTKSRKRSTSGG